MGYLYTSRYYYIPPLCFTAQCGLPVTMTVVHAVADRYWATVAQHATVFPDATALIQQLRTAGVAVHLATGSDGFLTFNDERQTFTYAPKEAVRRKLARLHGLTALGLGPGNISIGDPIGKPHLDFFRAVLHHFSGAIGQEVELARTVAIGDSFTNDIFPLLDLGAACGLWLLRERSAFGDQQRWHHPQVTVVNTLDAGEVQQLFFTT
jgi:FMN phosphatase YigB (HAD superfamily)